MQALSKLKRLALILTIGNLGLHHLLDDQWTKCLGLLLSFVFCLFSLMANFFFIQHSGLRASISSFGDMMLHPDSIFTYIFYAGFVLNRILWMLELFNFFRFFLKS